MLSHLKKSHEEVKFKRSHLKETIYINISRNENSLHRDIYKKGNSLNEDIT